MLATGESDGHGHTSVLGGDDGPRRGRRARGRRQPARPTPGGVIRRYPHEDAHSRAIAVAPRSAAEPPRRVRFPAATR